MFRQLGCTLVLVMASGMAMAQDAAQEALPEIPEADDAWDPFEDD